MRSSLQSAHRRKKNLGLVLRWFCIKYRHLPKVDNYSTLGLPRWHSHTAHLPMQETQEMGVQSLGQENPLDLPVENANPPVFLIEKSHGPRNLAGHSLWGCKESDMTGHACTAYSPFLGCSWRTVEKKSPPCWQNFKQGTWLFTLLRRIND